MAVIGGGASGTLQALHLLRAGLSNISLIERGALARGTAYGTRRPEHLLNVPARGMSAFADYPGHFARWLGARTGGGPEDFAPRMIYGDYLAELLAAAGSGIAILRGEAIAITPGSEVRLADGRIVAAEVAILAPGNFPPAVPRGVDAAALGAHWVADPWCADLAAGLGQADAMVLLGTGLTAIDAALTLDAAGFGGRIIALSRRGLAPRAHDGSETAAIAPRPIAQTCSGLVRDVRARAGAIGWRSAVHALRPLTQDLWAEAGLDQRRRFLRHLRPWWDVHRHKIAPAIAARVAAMVAEGRLAFIAGKLVSAEAEAGSDVLVRFRPRGGEAIEKLRAARIVNCTGPEPDIARCAEPLLATLLAEGRIRADPLRLGIDVDAESRARDAGGQASDPLFAIGPVTRGAFWESVAIPEIRVQAQRIAARIAA